MEIFLRKKFFTINIMKNWMTLGKSHIKFFGNINSYHDELLSIVSGEFELFD